MILQMALNKSTGQQQQKQAEEQMDRKCNCQELENHCGTLHNLFSIFMNIAFLSLESVSGPALVLLLLVCISFMLHQLIHQPFEHKTEKTVQVLQGYHSSPC